MKYLDCHRLVIVAVLSLVSGIGRAPAFGEQMKNSTTQQVAIEPDTSDLTIMASVRVAKDPSTIAMSWPPPRAACTSYTVYRRALGERDWTEPPIAKLPGDATAYTDAAVHSGVSYEYRIDRDAATYYGSGYVCAGIDVPLVEQRGVVLLLVDGAIAAAVEPELQRLQLDLVGDGWTVRRIDVPHATTAPQVKEMIVAAYRKDPKQVKSVFLLGHVAVPYSGATAYDGHADHVGAWPADVFYGTMEFPWTDTADYPKSYTIENAPRNSNKPGDGRYDPSNLPANSVQLQLGRVDLSDMPAFRQNEVELLRQYLNKDHRFRQGQLLTERGGIVKDSFGLFSGSAFAAGGWSAQSAYHTAAGVTRADWFPTIPRTKALLTGYGCGPGSYTSCAGVGETATFTEHDPGVVFGMLFGSYFGDWDVPNNFLRALLASPNTGLTSVWSGCPPVYLHHMGLGLPVGYSVQRSQNNGGQTDYLLWGVTKDGKRRRPWNDGGGAVHIALMGDPTLRLFVVPPPTELQATIGDAVVLHWKASDDAAVGGYHVYRSVTFDGPFTRLTQTPVSAPGYTDATSPARPGVYMIKAIKLEQTGSGTFYNSSQGAFLQVGAKQITHDVPRVKALSFTTRENQSVKIPLEAEIAAGQQVAYCFSQPSHGVLTGTAPNLVYIPNRYYSGQDSLTYTALDHERESAPAVVTVQVAYVQDTPIADALVLARHRSRPIACALSALDHHNHPLKYNILIAPKFGTLSGTGPALTYTPTTSDNVADSFTFCVSDGVVTSTPAVVVLEASYPCPLCTTPIMIDGNLQEWDALPYDLNSGVPMAEEVKRNWTGTQDGFYRFGVCRDADHVYIGIQVTDNNIMAKPGVDPWRQDSVEVRIDARPDTVRFSGTGENEMTDFLFVNISPGAVATAPYILNPEKLPQGCRYACARTKDGYATEIAIPVSYFEEKGGKDWDGFRLNLFVNDHDSEGGPRKQFLWKPDWRSWSTIKSYAGSGSFFLP